ncbi:uncharacterized protein [Drosophila kikkawai]|uniref:Uncharacterized protein isoform X2 n=1 Tax=Drosophila kikkawai TaxID=30033 RepID=A0ABM4GMB3_DROKI
MTSFGAEVVQQSGYNPSYKIQGQIHHRAGALLPPQNKDHKFLQIYFIGDSEVELNHRCPIFTATKREIIQNELLRLFKTALDIMHYDEHKIIISADKRPTGSHARQFNAPTINEVAVVIVGENVESHDIVLKRRDNGQLQRVYETHRSYDALQYPLMFCRGEDGYHFNIKMVNPTTGEETNKKVSCMNFYAYRLMIRLDVDNHLLRYRRLFQQYCVDMYVKVETERLNFIRFNQSKLRSDEYIHLRDAIPTEGHPANIRFLTILPATYVGSPRHMHEYAQDAMTYVRNYGRPDLFITFTCNPKWPEITNLLLPGQTSSDRPDITARVCKQKITVLMDYIVKQKVFGAVRCWMYSVEWQKRGLPHAHILLWMFDKIRLDHIDSIISAEIPDKQTDPELHSIVTTSMIHGPCGVHNPESVCMKNGNCTKRFPRPLTAETISGNDGYPLYRRRSPDDNGKWIELMVKRNETNVTVIVDNRWIVPYCPLLSKTFSTHCNVEYCNSIKSIKYVCKYVNKGSDMAVFGIADPNANDEVTKFQLGISIFFTWPAIRSLFACGKAVIIIYFYTG